MRSHVFAISPTERGSNWAISIAIPVTRPTISASWG